MTVTITPPQTEFRQGMPANFRRAGRVYAIAFDMDSEALRINYGDPYNTVSPENGDG